MKKNNKDLAFFYVIAAIFALIIVAVLIYPIIVMIKLSFTDHSTGTFTLNNYARIFSERQYISGFKNSILLSIYSSILGLLITIIATFIIYFKFPKLKNWFLSLANLTANYVGVPLSFGLIILLGNAGILRILDQQLGWGLWDGFSVYSLNGLMIAFIYFQIPLGITLLMPIYDVIDKNWKEAAAVLGASDRQFWRRIGIPILMPSFINILVLMFVNAIGTYDTAVALTGSSVNMISINIANTISGDIFALPEVGSALSVVLGIILLINMIIGNRITKRARRMA